MSDLAAQLSQQLRTRLSYAMVKVKNGWESHTFKEIEGLTSPLRSPNAPLSPSSPGSRLPIQAPPRSPEPKRAAYSRPGQGDDITYAENITAARGSNHFDVKAQRHLRHNPRMVNGSEQHDLAPPADVTSAARRQKPHLAHSPYTRSQATAPEQRTPTQNAAMEADAVETLLFMASPGNSGHHPSSSAVRSSPAWTSGQTSSQNSPNRPEPVRQEPARSPHTRTASATNLLATVCNRADASLHELDSISPVINGKTRPATNEGP